MDITVSFRTAATAILVALGASHATAQPELVGTEAVFHVTDYGACPNDGILDHIQVQAAVDAAVAYISATSNCADGTVRRAVVFFPKGTYQFGKSVTYYRMYGIDVRGAAHGQYANASPSNGAATVLERAGEEPIFIIDGSSTLRFEHLMLTDSPGPALTARPLVEVNAADGAGTSHLQFKEVTLSNAYIGVGVTDSNNNSEFLFEHVNFQNIATCFKPGRHQSLNHLFNLVTAVNCGTVFDLTYGGNVSVNIGNFYNCNSDYIIKMGGDHPGGGGPNIGVSRFANVRIDATASTFKLIWIRGWQKVEFDALNIQEVSAGERPVGICLVENGSLSFNACQFNLGNIVHCVEGSAPSSDARRAIRFRDCNFGIPIDLTLPPPIDACALGIITSSATLTNTAYCFEKCENSYGANVFVPLADCKHPTTGLGW